MRCDFYSVAAEHTPAGTCVSVTPKRATHPNFLDSCPAFADLHYVAGFGGSAEARLEFRRAKAEIPCKR